MMTQKINGVIYYHAKSQPPLTGREGGSQAEPCELAPDGLCHLVHYADAKVTRNAEQGKEGLHRQTLDALQGEARTP